MQAADSDRNEIASDRADHQRQYQVEDSDANRFEAGAEQKENQYQNLLRTAEREWGQLNLFRDRITSKIETAQNLYDLALDQAIKYVTNWLLASISETERNLGEIMARIISVMMISDVAAILGLSHRSGTTLNIGAMAAIQTPPREAYDRYLQQINDINSDNRDYVGRAEELTRTDENNEEVAADAAHERSRERDARRQARIEERLSEEARSQLDANRRRSEDLRRRDAELRERMNQILRDGQVQPS